MKKALQIIAIIFLILIDLTFIDLTLQDARGQKESIDRYFWFQKYASEIEREFNGKINVNQVTIGQIAFRISPEASPADCISVVKMVSEWRQADERLVKIHSIFFYANGSEGTKYTMLFPTGFVPMSLYFSRDSDESTFNWLHIYPCLGDEFYKLSSYSSIEENFILSTEAFVELDDESILSKIMEWKCDEGLYTEQELADIEDRGIPVTVWEEEDVA